jgi:hypothetical protein
MEWIDAKTVVLTPDEAADAAFKGAIERGLLQPGIYLDPAVRVVDGRITLTFTEFLPKVRRRTRYRRCEYSRQPDENSGAGEAVAWMFALLMLLVVIGAMFLPADKPQSRSPSTMSPEQSKAILDGLK